MNSSSNSVTACRLCQHYSPEGRRDGFCGKLDVSVRATWNSCSLAAHPFDDSWQLGNNLSPQLVSPQMQVIRLERQEVTMRSLSFSEH